MANSIIDDMLKDQIPDDNSKKKKSTLKFFIIVLIILLIVLGVGAFVYLKITKEVSPKLDFFKYLKQSNVLQVFECDTYDELAEKMQTSSFETTSQLSCSIGGNLVEDIDDIELTFSAQVDPENLKAYADTKINYANTDIAYVEVLATEKGVGIKEKDIVREFVGSKYENLARVISQITGEELNDAEILNNFNLEELIANIQENSSVSVSDDVFEKYVKVIEDNVDDMAFTTKEVILKKENGNVNVTEYAMTISETQMIDILKKLIETFKNDTEIMTLLTSSLDEFGIASDVVEMYLDEIITSIDEIEIDESRKYTTKVYVANEQTVKVSINCADLYSIDFEYEYGKTTNSILITFANFAEETGISVKLEKNKEELTETTKAIIDMIELEIKDTDGNAYDLSNYNLNQVAELVISSKVMKSGTSYKLTNKASLSFALFNFDIENNSTITFKNVDIEDLSDDNCLFVDDLDINTFNDIIEAIGIQINEVITPKLENIAVSLPTNESDDENVVEEINGEAKEEAKNKIIQYVSEAMTEAQNNGETYTLSDLEKLEIPDSDFTVSINDTIAVITIDGYEFTLDSSFNLSD